MIKVDVVGHILVSGTGITSKTACANLCVCANEEEAVKNFNEGDILVISQTSNTLLPLLKKASGIITEQDGLNSHAVIVGLAIDRPVMIGAAQATEILKSGTVVIMDASRGIVSNK
jgi:pyruvate kinase